MVKYHSYKVSFMTHRIFVDDSLHSDEIELFNWMKYVAGKVPRHCIKLKITGQMLASLRNCFIILKSTAHLSSIKFCYVSSYISHPCHALIKSCYASSYTSQPCHASIIPLLCIGLVYQHLTHTYCVCQA